ncbi:relaxase/mobilization nuclease domain-containing protein [Lactococcus garvieae]|uniref:relaxase/mobilization nuclease domain-containing protein n=1 Tax=Lactococcus garvieae TaxID=1363 RepID=UPI00385290AD
MVYTKHIPIHTMKHLHCAKDYAENAKKVSASSSTQSHLDHIFPYVLNDEKNLTKQLVSGYHIRDVYKASKEFIATKKAAALRQGKDLDFNPQTQRLEFKLSSLEKNNAVLARHLIQSFHKDDQLSPEEIHEIGRQTVLEFTGGEYEFVIATHTDRSHVHNHIIVNTTNRLTGKALPWKIVPDKHRPNKSYDVTKANFEKVSDKIASRFAVEHKRDITLIEKSPANSHTKYTLYQTESLYKNKIKSRVDFLLAHSSSLSDFKEKALALDLEVHTSGKWTTYRLLDEPQVQVTRSRSLGKKNQREVLEENPYNVQAIEKTLAQNVGVFTLEDVLEVYEEQVEAYKEDFDYQVLIEGWQIDHWSEKGLYLNVDFGIESRGQIFIGGFRVDKLDNGDCLLYAKKKETFYFMDEKGGRQNKYITGERLVRQLALYNGTTPLRKIPVISTMDQLTSAIRFLSAHGVREGRQMSQLNEKLTLAVEEARSELDNLDEMLLNLGDLEKALLMDEGESFLEHHKHLNVSPEVTLSEVQGMMKSTGQSKDILEERFKETVGELNRFNEIRYEANRLAAEEKAKRL